MGHASQRPGFMLLVIKSASFEAAIAVGLGTGKFRILGEEE